jgi:hypothetical protein
MDSLFSNFVSTSVCMRVCVCVCVYIYGARGSVIIKALCYKPEGCGFDTR